NAIQAAATNRTGTGPLSTAVTVTLNTDIPQAPTALTAQAKENGQIRLSWQRPGDTDISGYNLYRAQSPFTDVSGASKVNTGGLFTATSHTDLPGTDTTWYYRVTAVNSAANESEPSAQAVAEADSTPPTAVSITYSPQGNFDPQSGTMAPGRVDLALTLSEPLMTDPFLSITPVGGVPMSVEITQDSATQYSGYFTITDNAPAGTAYAVFSARDLAGNRGDLVESGDSLLIDARGPSVTSIVILPTAPVKNDELSPVTVTVTVGLNEAMKTGELAQLS
ncbi:MAG: hypothetical protein GY867_05960, partial [bacterium]|nr:hypothetical protein [bacterium]